MTDELGHDIANSNSFRVASEGCPDHFSYERCPERYHLLIKKDLAGVQSLKKLVPGQDFNRVRNGFPGNIPLGKGLLLGHEGTFQQAQGFQMLAEGRHSSFFRMIF